MTMKWVLLKTIQREPENRLACYAMADLLEEGGWHDRRPGRREGSRLRKRFVWYKEGAFESWPGDEAERYSRLPAARLDRLVYESLPRANSQYQLYGGWEQAVKDLAQGLARMRALLEKPPGV